MSTSKKIPSLKDVFLASSHFTAEAYQNAVNEIDKVHGDGYAKRNPHSVNHFMQLQTAVVNTIHSCSSNEDK